MKKLLSILACAIMCFTLTILSSCGKKADYTVGICQLLQHAALDKATEGFIAGLKEKMDEAGKTIKFDSQNASGEIPQCSTIISKFVSSGYDLIMANATPALQTAVNLTTSIPILGTSITEYGVALNINNFTGTVGGNVSGTSDLAPLDKQAQMITTLFPNATTVTILYCSAEANSKYQADVVKAELEKASITVTIKTFTDSNDLQSVANTVSSDVLYIPTDNTCASNAELIKNIMNGKNIPIIAGEEELCKNVGAVATLSISYYQIGLQTGYMAARILLEGADISTMPIEYDNNYIYKYNATVAANYSVTIPQNYQQLGE